MSGTLSRSADGIRSHIAVSGYIFCEIYRESSDFPAGTPRLVTLTLPDHRMELISFGLFPQHSKHAEVVLPSFLTLLPSFFPAILTMNLLYAFLLRSGAVALEC